MLFYCSGLLHSCGGGAAAPEQEAITQEEALPNMISDT